MFNSKIEALRREVLAGIGEGVKPKPKQNKKASSTTLATKIVRAEQDPADKELTQAPELDPEQEKEKQTMPSRKDEIPEKSPVTAEEKKDEEEKPGDEEEVEDKPKEGGKKKAEDDKEPPKEDDDDKGDEEDEDEEEDDKDKKARRAAVFGSLTPDAEVEMVLMGASGDDPAWFVFHKGNPVARITRSAQGFQKDIKLNAYFCSEEYAQSLIKSAQSIGYQQVLANVKAEAYLKKPYTVNAAVDEREVKHRTISEFTNVASLVWTAMQKNLIDHPLKDALYSAMEEKGIQSPVDVIEVAFGKAGSTFLPFILDRTRKMLNMNASARKDFEEILTGLSARVPSENTAASFGSLLEDNSVPLTTGPASTPGDRKDYVKRLLG